MEEKKVSEVQSAGKERLSATAKLINQVNKKLGTRGRVIVIFSIVIIWALGACVAHIDERHEKFYDRGYGMMEGREGMMVNSRRGLGRSQERIFGRSQNGQFMQGCTQQAALKIDPNNPDTQLVSAQLNCPFANQTNPQENPQSDSIFDRMESRMKQMFGSEDNQVNQISIPITGTIN